jgi:hypothetical protein
MASGVFQAEFLIGDGMNTIFWRDRRIMGRSAEEIAPAVVALVKTRWKNTRRVGQALTGNRWISDITGDMNVESCLQCIKLWEKIDEVPRDASRPNRIYWKGIVSGEYSAKVAYDMLCQGNTSWSMAMLVWRSFAPMKCKSFSWLALRYGLWTSNRRARHGL